MAAGSRLTAKEAREMAKWIKDADGDLINLDHCMTIQLSDEARHKEWGGSTIFVTRRSTHDSDRGTQCYVVMSSTNRPAIIDAFNRLTDDLNPIQSFHHTGMASEVINDGIDELKKQIEELRIALHQDSLGLPGPQPNNQPQRPDPAGMANTPSNNHDLAETNQTGE
jgi:hypothetical protein